MAMYLEGIFQKRTPPASPAVYTHLFDNYVKSRRTSCFCFSSDTAIFLSENKIEGEKSMTSWNLCEQNDSVIKEAAVLMFIITHRWNIEVDILYAQLVSKLIITSDEEL